MLAGPPDALERWAAHLTAEGVAHSGAYRVDGLPAAFLTFRDPDGIQVELIALDAAGR